VFHLELRKAQHAMNRFNVPEQELGELVRRWVRGHAVEIGDRSWRASETELTILEGPELAPGELALGRGWRNARRRGTDVTEKVLSAARGSAAGSASSMPAAGEPAASAGDALAMGVQLGALLGPDAARLLDAWRSVAAEMPGLAPSEAIAEAERRLEAGAGEQP
jgi:hypothetical protein